MRIRRLKLSGFKSFVEPTELRIEPGLTGMGGPNGCVKCNRVVAVRCGTREAGTQPRGRSPVRVTGIIVVNAAH